MHDFKKLRVWNEASAHYEEVHKVLRSFPRREFSLIDQIKRAALSISGNIAEACGRRTKGEFVHFLSIGLGSAFELESHLLNAQRVGFLQEERLLERVIEVKCMLFGLIRSTGY